MKCFKKCIKCLQAKHLYEYHKDSSRADGLHVYCKQCANGSRDKKLRKEYDFIRRHEPKRRYVVYKGRAKKKQIVFLLTFKEFSNLTSLKCFYCHEYSKDKDFCGIDRIDSNLGYVLENCQPCCDVCNYMKQEMSHEEFVCHVRKIASVLEGGK